MRRFRLFLSVFLFFFLAEVQAQVVLQRCDRINLWSGSNVIEVDHDDMKEGIGALQFTGNGVEWFAKRFSQTYTGIDESGYLHLWLYVSNPGNFVGEGSVEVSSSGGPDTDEYSWNLSSLNLISGWNELTLPISSATQLGSPDLNAVNYFRVYQNLSGSITAKIDDIRFLESNNQSLSDDPLDIPPVDFNTLDGKVMFGYQGWFLHPDDGSSLASWRHWGGDMSSTDDLTVDMFPDFREYEADELFLTGDNFFSYPDGRPVRVYSAYKKKTVERHMKWIRDYGLDGVFLQRFITNARRDDALRRARDTVTANIMSGCEKYGRTFANMWDISGVEPGHPEYIINDWKHLVDDLEITGSPGYLHHRGRPLIAIWGYSVRDEFPVSELQTLLDFFKGESTPEKYRATVMLGVDHDFHQRSNWTDVMVQADVVSPWAVGRFGDDNGQERFMNEHVLPGQDWCDNHNVDFLPVIWPGFSWANLKDDEPNKRPRRGGNFFWTQATRVISGNAKSVYIAMFDEVDESTAMYKLAENAQQAPAQGYWLTLDADGYDLPSDWYLRCAKQATEIVRGNMNNRTTLGTPPDGIDAFTVQTISAICGADNGKLILKHPVAQSENFYEFSIDGGVNFSYSASAGSAEIVVKDLKQGVYNVWVRNQDDSYPTDLGPYTIFDTEPSATVFAKDSSCSQAGMIHFLIEDLPYTGEVQISIDSGKNYNYTSTVGKWHDTIFNVSSGTYPVWIRSSDGTCEQMLDTKTVSKADFEIGITPMLDGVQTEDVAKDTIFACPGSSLILFLSPVDNKLNFTTTGPGDFFSDSRSFQLSGALTAEMFGKYEVSYTNPDGCEVSSTFVLAYDQECDASSHSSFVRKKLFEFYPNPANDIITIQNYTNSVVILDIFNSQGQKIIQSEALNSGSKSLDISTLNSGLYFLLIKDENGNNFCKPLLKNAVN